MRRAHQVEHADFDGDGRGDLVIRGQDARRRSTVAIVFGARVRRFVRVGPGMHGRVVLLRPVPAAMPVSAVAVADLDADRVPDLVVSAAGSGGARVGVVSGRLLAERPARVRVTMRVTVPGAGLVGRAVVALGDVTGDGLPEVAFGEDADRAGGVRVVTGADLRGRGPVGSVSVLRGRPGERLGRVLAVPGRGARRVFATAPGNGPAPRGAVVAADLGQGMRVIGTHRWSAPREVVAGFGRRLAADDAYVAIGATRVGCPGLETLGGFYLLPADAGSKTPPTLALRFESSLLGGLAFGRLRGTRVLAAGDPGAGSGDGGVRIYRIRKIEDDDACARRP